MEATEVVLTIIDQSGRAVYQNKAEVEPGEHTWIVPLAGLPAGQYTTTMAKGLTSESVRFIVLR